ncbi:MAG TPA: TIGR02266 family protein [Thermodesulfobacteriaceae bacterium]|nr:TIGR02266 family protein [Thermodesulfobacteriaceae bacterium]
MGQVSADSGKRAARRAPAVIQVDYRTVDRFFTDFAENLSTGGLFIATPRPLEPGTTLILEFLLPECHHPIRVKAEVMWNTSKLRRMKGQRRGMGLKFANLSQRDRKKIDVIVSKLKSSRFA